jgi:dihydroflavonol-4-reductase
MPLALVTGGSGFVGRHLVNELLLFGDDVRVLDIADPPEPSPKFEFVRGSAADEAVVERALDRVDCLYHLAGIPHLWRDNQDDFDAANHRSAETVMRVATRMGIARIVHCSTESILLPKRRRETTLVDESAHPALEDMPGPYTRSKLLGERTAFAAAEAGAHVVVVNPTIPIGVGDLNTTPPAAMFSLFLSGKVPFFLDCELNLADVRDMADGMIRAGQHGRRGERYILGGENIALHDLLPILEKKSGRRMPRRAVPAALAIVTGIVNGWISDTITHRPPAATKEGVILALRSQPFDSGRAKKELGYAPRPIDRALTEVVEEFKRKSADGNS